MKKQNKENKFYEIVGQVTCIAILAIVYVIPMLVCIMR